MGRKGRYIKPRTKMSVRAIFCEVGSCSFHMFGIGMSHTARSVMMFTMAYPMAKSLNEMHCPWPVQNPLIGMQLKMARKIVMIVHTLIIAPTAYTILRNRDDTKIRRYSSKSDNFTVGGPRI